MGAGRTSVTGEPSIRKAASRIANNRVRERPLLQSHEIAVVRALEPDYRPTESRRRIFDDQITFGCHFGRHALLFTGMTRKNVTVSVATAHAGSR